MSHTLLLILDFCITLIRIYYQIIRTVKYPISILVPHTYIMIDDYNPYRLDLYLLKFWSTLQQMLVDFFKHLLVDTYR